MISQLGSVQSVASAVAGITDPVSVIDAHEVAALFPGAACVAREDGVVLAASPGAAELKKALVDEVRSGAPGTILRLARQAITFSRPFGGRLTLADEADPAAGPRAFDIAVLPCRREPNSGSAALILAFETTLERNLRRALIASRDLFRDLVGCSAEFAWETDTAGAFTFIGGRGALGYSAAALHGRHSASLIDVVRSPAAEAAKVFGADAPIDDLEVWLRSADGDSHCFLISAIPVLDGSGHRRGTRGIGRDITALRLREAELARAKAREDVSRAIVDAMLGETNVTDMLATAARSLALAVKCERSWILLRDETGSYDVGAAFGIMPHGARQFLPPEIARPVLDAQALVAFENGGWSYLGTATVLRGAINGGICIASPVEPPPFTAETRALLELVGKHTAVAIAQASQLRTLVDLARSDELTGLANRRAFGERYEAWSAKALPTATAAILYIDLDDFKTVNDRAGHAAGDALLRAFASLLRRDSRRRDLAIRLGGDEFAVFMEGMSDEHLAPRVSRLLRAAADIPLPDCVGGGSIKMSVGAAMTRAGDKESAAEILERADQALYDAKRGGKGQVVFAPAKQTARREDGPC